MLPHQKLASYKQVHVTTASPGKQIVMLYDAVLKHLREAQAGFEHDPTTGFEIIHNGIHQATNILLELNTGVALVLNNA